MTTEIGHDAEGRRYELREGDAVAALVDYTVDGDRITFTHTESDPAFSGRGLATELVRAALDDARRRGLAVLPLCPFVRRVIGRDPEAYLDLVPESERDRFGLGGVRPGPAAPEAPA